MMMIVMMIMLNCRWGMCVCCLSFADVMSYMGDRKSSKGPIPHAKKMLRNLMVDLHYYYCYSLLLLFLLLYCYCHCHTLPVSSPPLSSTFSHLCLFFLLSPLSSPTLCLFIHPFHFIHTQVAPVGLRDEVYMQICKQTTGNPKPSSTIKG